MAAGNVTDLSGVPLQQYRGTMVLDDQPPVVQDVLVRGSSWSEGFLDYLDAVGMGHPEIPRLGYLLPDAAVWQSELLPWDNVDIFTVVFDEEVIGQESGATVVSFSASMSEPTPVSGFRPDARALTWQFDKTLGSGNHLASVHGLVSDYRDNSVDMDFQFRLSVLAGDADQSGVVDELDDAAVRGSLFLTTDGLGYSPMADFNGSGMINVRDGLVLRDNMLAQSSADWPGPPMVESVIVRGSDWSEAFLDHLDLQGLGHATVPRLGYAIPAGLSQLDTLPWENIDTVAIVFSEAVDVAYENLMLGGSPDGPVLPSIAAFEHIPPRIAVWRFNAPLDASKYLVSLEDTIQDTLGNALDGEWLAGSDAFPSGNGTPGGDFHFRFNVLPGDANQSGMTNVRDGLGLRERIDTVPGDPNYSPMWDFAGDGAIDVANDETTIQTNMFTWLPAGEPEAPLLLVAGSGDTAVLAATGETTDETVTTGSAFALANALQPPMLDGLAKLGPLSFKEYRSIISSRVPIRSLAETAQQPSIPLSAEPSGLVHRAGFLAATASEPANDVVAAAIEELTHEMDRADKAYETPDPVADRLFADMLCGPRERDDLASRAWRRRVDGAMLETNVAPRRLP